MSLERGTYGIEYDGNQRGSGGRLWLLTLLLPVVVIILVLRGCQGGGSVYRGDDAVPDERLPPEVEVKRERPSLAVHFIDAWKRKFSGERPAESSASGAPGTEDGQTGAESADGGIRRSERTVAAAGISDEVGRLLARSDELRTGGNLVSARMILEKLRLRPEAEGVRPLIETRIGEINSELVFADKAMPGKLRHTIERGDLVSRLSRRYGNTQEYILRVNAIDRPERIRIGQELWLLDNPIFELMIDKSDRRAVLLLNHRFFKVYSVGLGAGDAVPAGGYAVHSRLEDPERRQGSGFSIALRPLADDAAITALRMRAASNLSDVGRTTATDGILFAPVEMEELYVLLPAGSTVTVVE
jgi:hypothetical protein